MSRFSDFFRNATHEERARVFDDVMRRATAQQVAIRTTAAIPDAQISLEVCDVIDADYKDPKEVW